MLPEVIRKKFEEQYVVSLREYDDSLIERIRGKKVIGSSTQPKIVERNRMSMENTEDDIEGAFQNGKRV